MAESSSLSLKLPLVFFILITTFPSSRCKDNENFTRCGLPYECGDVKNLHFPFWGGDRPQFCGHEGFELRCWNREFPVINITGLDYRVLNVDETSNTMTLARLDLWDTPCSSNLEFVNTTLNPPLFNNYTQGAVNLTLFYESSGVDFPYNFTCNGQDFRGTRNYYVNDSFLENFLSNVTERCTGGIVQTLIFEAAFKEDPGNGLQELSRTFQEGFGVNYTNFPLCTACELSGGRCGSGDGDNDQNKFYCFCRTGREDHVCSTHTSGNYRGWRIKTTIGIVSGGSALLFVCIITCCLRAKTSIKSWTKRTKDDQVDVEAFIRSYGQLTAKRYRFLEVKKMTKSFKDKLGQGGFGEVYRGKILDGHLVAVKILKASKGNGEEFINEVASISRTSHVNIVTLLGFCLEGKKRALIYEFMPNGSLEKFTYKDNPLKTTPCLEWEKLLQISIGIARGLEYLHRGCNTKIIHFDIKPHNILLDEDFCPKISDFGLAKLCPRKDSIVSMTNARGTIGYIAPEVYNRNFGGVSSKSDVYSYGMMILEMVGGRKNVKARASHSSEIYFPDWIYKHLELNSNLQLWGDMTNDENEIARKMIIVGLWCIQNKQSDRPSMTKVIEMLEGNIEALHIPPNPSMFSSRSPERLPVEPLVESSTTAVL